MNLKCIKTLHSQLCNKPSFIQGKTYTVNDNQTTIYVTRWCIPKNERGVTHYMSTPFMKKYFGTTPAIERKKLKAQHNENLLEKIQTLEAENKSLKEQKDYWLAQWHNEMKAKQELVEKYGR